MDKAGRNALSKPKSRAVYLSQIVAHKTADPSTQRRKQEPWEAHCRRGPLPARRPFAAALLAPAAGHRPRIIAEMKRASPSQGRFPFQGTVAQQVAAYQRGGARAVSVLTNEAFFQGRPEDLAEAREACQLPLLRKDFLLEPWEVWESRWLGADAILLIAAILDQDTLVAMLEQASQAGVETLLEIHDEAELDRVLALPRPPEAVGINNRDLQTFELTLETTARLAPRLPKEICRVSESGFATRQDLVRFEGMVDAFLIGESLMRSARPEETLTSWIEG